MNIRAIHQHMAHDQSHYLFMHYWGKGETKELAKTIKKALDAEGGPIILSDKRQSGMLL